VKVLLTGMTSAQCNPAAHKKVNNYSGRLAEALREAGHQVDWRDPRLNDFLDDYDSIIVGLAPLGSLGANRAYGALDVIAFLRDDPRLRLLVDAPDPEKLETGLAHMLADPDKLFKPFFSYRKEYALASTPFARKRILDTADWLAHDTWPTTIVPALPWTAQASVEERLVEGARGRVRPVCLDHWTFEAASPELERVDRPSYWAYEASSWDKWLPQQNVSWEVVKVPRSARVESDTAALQVLRDARGCLIAPGRHGLWWNTRFAQSLAQGTPVFTDWSEAQYLDSSFTVLPGTYEYDPDPSLAEIQRKVYLDAIGSKNKAINTLEQTLQRK
jgi:hypothetical protein